VSWSRYHEPNHPARETAERHVADSTWRCVGTVDSGREADGGGRGKEDLVELLLVIKRTVV
jgi:hypothetical protein